MPNSGFVKDLGIKAGRFRTNWVAQLHFFEAEGLSPQVRQLSNGAVYFQGVESETNMRLKLPLRSGLLLGLVPLILATLAAAWMFAPKAAAIHRVAGQVHSLARATQLASNSPFDCEFQELTLEKLQTEHPQFKLVEQIRIGDIRQLKLSGVCNQQSYLVTLRVVDDGRDARIEKVAYSTE